MKFDNNSARQPSWKNSAFGAVDEDPLTGFANIMDVMLVFALGLMLALVVRSQELQNHFELTEQTSEQREITTGKELTEMPESIKEQLNGGSGMEPLGQVYRDPETGKLILIGGQ